MTPRLTAPRSAMRRPLRACLALILLAFLALGVVPSSASAGTDATTAGRAEQRFLAAARGAVRAGDAATAKRYYLAAHAANGDSVEALVALGLFAEQADERDQARANYERAIEIDALRAILTPGGPPSVEWEHAIAIAQGRLAVLDGLPVKVVSDVPIKPLASNGGVMEPASTADVQAPDPPAAAVSVLPPIPGDKPAPPSTDAAPSLAALETHVEPGAATGVGLHLASARTPDQARAIVQALQESNADVLGRLGLHVAVEKRDQPASVSFRVMAGPVADPAIAAQVCGTLVARGLYCATSAF